MKSQWRGLILILILAVVFSCEKAHRYPLLRNSQDPDLQAALLKSLNQEMEPEFLDALAQKRASVVLVDITDPFRPKGAWINPDEMMYAASLPKIAILLGVFVQIDRGEIAFDDRIRKTCTRMIRQSSNEAASEMLRLVGPDKLAQILQSKRYRLYDPDYNGGLWVGRDYSGSPVWKRDPLNGISHGATAMQAARFYYLLFTERLVPAKLTSEMKKILSKTALDHKFVKGLNDDRQSLEIYRKSGTWKNWHSDSGVIEHKNFTYIIVALTRLRQGGERLSRLSAVVDDFMKLRHTD